MAYVGADAGNQHILDGGFNFMSSHQTGDEHQPFSNAGLHESLWNVFVPGNWIAGCSTNMSMQMQMQMQQQQPQKDCAVFVHTGFCSFGDGCRYRHPPPENAVQVDEQVEENNGNPSESEPEKLSPPIIPCKYYPAGLCKIGEKCKLDHSLPERFNIMGLPFRWGAPECCFYMRNGWCGFGLACKFHHPDPLVYYPADEHEEYVVRKYFEYRYGSSDAACFMYQGSLLQPPIIGNNYDQPNFSWNAPTDDQLPPQQDNLGMHDSYMNADMFSNRPYYRPVKVSYPVLNEAGLPLRPGKKVCWHYERSGDCEYGSVCAFDHPPKFTESSDVDQGSTSKSVDPGAKAPETHE